MLIHLHLKARCLDRKKVFNVSAAAENTLKIYPATLNIYPDIKAIMDTIELVRPANRLLLKLLKVKINLF